MISHDVCDVVGDQSCSCWHWKNCRTLRPQQTQGFISVLDRSFRP